MKTFVSALAFASVLAIKPVAAQDLGFQLPSKETVEAQKESRKNQAAGQSTGRAIMDAFELYEQEQLQEAIAILEEEYPDLDPGYDQAYMGRFLGTLYAQDEQIERALRILETSADQDVLGWNDQAAVLKLTGQLALQEEQYDMSIDYLTQWLRFTGKLDPQVLTFVANAYYQKKEFGNVVPFARAALNNAEEPDKNIYTLLMASYYERKMYPQAIGILEEAINILPGVQRWWPQLAQFYMIEEDFTKSLATMEVAYMAGYLSKENQFKMLVQLYDNEGIPYKAATVMAKHIENGDIEGTAKNFATVANSFHRAKEFDEAVAWYERAVDAADDADDKGEYLRKRGNLLLLDEQYIAATSPLREALDYVEEDDQGRIYMSLAEAFFYGGEYREALRYAERAAQFDGQRRSARSWVGHIKATAERKGASL
ncbi:MAG: tetratricopeptide repeat protein [Pseudomonadota bacterium]